jgi:two-component system NtrC family response regulator
VATHAACPVLTGQTMRDDFFSSATDHFTVLVVEDEPRLREMLLRAIPDMGFAAEGVGSAEQALKLLKDQPRHVLILDLNLPGMTGLDLLAKVREDWPKIQAVVLTGFGDLDAAKQAIHLDVVEFLTKPCTLGDLEHALERARRRLMPEPGKAAPAGEMLGAAEPLPPAAGLEKTEAPATRYAAGDSGDDAQAESADQLQKLADIERKHILQTLEQNRGNRAATARQLGISVRTLYYRLDEYRAQGYCD